MCFQKTPRSLYLYTGRTISGDFSLNLEVLYVVAIMSTRVFWMPVLGELLYTEQELGNAENRYAVSMLKLLTIVGHIPREISNLC